MTIKRSYRKILIITVCLFLAALSVVFPTNSYASEPQEKVLRVAYPIQAGLTMRNEDGTLSGYTYDYLMEISQYTGWRYEFVFIDAPIDEQLTTFMDMLEKGEIDLLGALYFDDALADVYTYSSYCYGINYSGLFVPENSRLRESSIYNIEKLRVGVHSKSLKTSTKLEQFAQMNNLNIEQITAQSSAEFYNLISSGKADAILSSDISNAQHPELYPIARFSPMPFYFATTKGNTEIIKQLDYALTTIDQVNPNFMLQLYNQYFSRKADKILLTEEEKKFIESSGTLEVVMYNNKPPFQYIDKATGKPTGITVEILDNISKATGLSFHYNTVSSYEEYIAYIENGRAELAADALINYQDAIDLKSSLTVPWSTLPISRFLGSDSEFTEAGRIAVPYFLKNVITANQRITYYNTVEECMNAVKNGFADYGYAGEFCTQYYMNTHRYEKIKTVHQADFPNQNICFAVSDSSNINLLTILNKSITALPKETVNEIIYRNTYQQATSFYSIFLANKNMFMATFMTLIAVIFLISYYVKSRQQQRIAFENKRYDVISNLANEYFYEYNIQNDHLALSEKCARHLHCDQNIPDFSKQLSEIKFEERCGIWHLGDYIISNTEGTWEISCQMPNNTRQWFELISTVIYNRKSKAYAVGKITDIQEAKSIQIRLEQQASLDGLTGIYNIATFKRLIRNHLEQLDANVPCALLILDIDSFKQINDTFGHYNGDAVLTQGAELIKKFFPNSLAGRLGGDEFVIFVLKAQQPDLETQCATLCEALLEKTKIMLGTGFSWSIGITWAKNGKTFEDLYKEADQALYQTKSTTKNGYNFFEEQ